MANSDRPRMKKAVTAAAVLESVLKGRGIDEKLRTYRAWQIWDETVGPQIARHAHPSRLRDGLLEVCVDQPVWMQQLQLMKPSILGRLNDRLDGAVIRDIYWRRARIDKKSNSAPEPSLSTKWQKITLDEEELSRIEATLAPLDDPELKQHMRTLFIRQAKLEKARMQTIPSEEE